MSRRQVFVVCTLTCCAIYLIVFDGNVYTRGPHPQGVFTFPLSWRIVIGLLIWPVVSTVASAILSALRGLLILFDILFSEGPGKRQ